MQRSAPAAAEEEEEEDGGGGGGASKSVKRKHEEDTGNISQQTQLSAVILDFITLLFHVIYPLPCSQYL